jgi:hypothetical protein
VTRIPRNRPSFVCRLAYSRAFTAAVLIPDMAPRVRTGKERGFENAAARVSLLLPGDPSSRVALIMRTVGGNQRSDY